MGHFPQKNFRSPLAPKLLVGLKKSWGCKNGTDILYLQAKFGGESAAARWRKKQVGCFCFFLFVCHVLDLEHRFSHSNSDIVAICR